MSELLPASGKDHGKEPGMYELDYVKMGARIRQFRKAKGWSQAKLAKRCGISMNFMGNIERGMRRMSMDTFASLCRELGTDADELLWGISERLQTPVYGMWKQAGKQDKEEDEDADEGADREKNNRDLSADKEDETYAIYVQIMKSVADILQDGRKNRSKGSE